VRQVLVRALLPAACPHELERARQLKQVSGGGGRKEVGCAVDRVERAVEGTRGVLVAVPGDSLLPAAEQRDDAVDVDHQQRALVRFGTTDEVFSLHRGSEGYCAEDGRSAEFGRAQ
jgi:hypothetical protein